MTELFGPADEFAFENSRVGPESPIGFQELRADGARILAVLVQLVSKHVKLTDPRDLKCIGVILTFSDNAMNVRV